jgi:hypothetical protein
MRQYKYDINILKNIKIELNKYNTSFNKNIVEFDRINNIINKFGKLPNFDNNFLEFLMFYQDKYISDVDVNRKDYVMLFYLKYQFKNNKIIEEISPIDNIQIKVNGNELFSPRDSTYFNSLIPYSRFKNSLPIGYYTYTFSLYPTEEQHSGHLNFTNFDDIVINLTSNDMVNNQPYKLNTIIKEYNILRIMSGFGSLGWIN